MATSEILDTTPIHDGTLGAMTRQAIANAVGKTAIAASCLAALGTTSLAGSALAGLLLVLAIGDGVRARRLRDERDGRHREIAFVLAHLDDYAGPGFDDTAELDVVADLNAAIVLHRTQGRIAVVRNARALVYHAAQIEVITLQRPHLFAPGGLQAGMAIPGDRRQANWMASALSCARQDRVFAARDALETADNVVPLRAG